MLQKPPVPLTMLIAKDIAFEWHEAVAIVAQVIAQARSGGTLPETLPEFRLMSLEDGGAVTAIAPEPSVPSMPGAALLLQQLLSGREQPPPLRLFAMQSANAEPPLTLDAFADELAKYERPGRTARIAALYNQALDAVGVPALLEAAKDRAERPLTVKTAGADASAAAAAAPKAKTKKPAAPAGRQEQGNTAFNAALAVIAVAAVAGGGAWYYLQQPLPAAPVEVAGTTEPVPVAPAEPRRTPRPAGVTTADATATDAAGTATNTAAAESQLAAARELLARREYASASTALERVLEMLRADRSPQAEELRRAASGLMDVSKVAGAEEDGAANRIYRSGDPGVTDPVPLSYLPPKPDPGTPPEELQVLEILVKADGTVDSAKFVMNRPSFRNSWWTSAAKAWRFEPAMKDGRPVPYTMRIVMDDSAAER